MTALLLKGCALGEGAVASILVYFPCQSGGLEERSLTGKSATLIATSGPVSTCFSL